VTKEEKKEILRKAFYEHGRPVIDLDGIYGLTGKAD